MLDREAAVAAAKRFLVGRAGAAGPFSARAEQDFWVISAPGADGAVIQVFVDLFNGRTSCFSEDVTDVSLSGSRPKT